MATAEQIKSLIRSHFDNDPERFHTIALQVAAYEAQQGNGAVAHDIRQIVDKARREKGPKVLKFPQDLRGLVLSEEPGVPLSTLVLPAKLQDRINRIIYEYRQQDKLKSHGLSNRRKILLIGPPGTGKTMSARVLAHEVRLPLYTIQVDKVVTKFMGETSAKLRQIFELIQQERGVYLFDEFDAIGGERTLENDVGEMRRVLNTFLQFIDQDISDSLVVAATNRAGRRFAVGLAAGDQEELGGASEDVAVGGPGTAGATVAGGGTSESVEGAYVGGGIGPLELTIGPTEYVATA